jgi:signal peptidase I
MRVPIQEHVPHLLKEALRTCGRVSFEVTGSSMLPAFWPGDRILVESGSFAELHAGDVVLYRREERIFVHRVITRVDYDTIVTRGDSMAANDPQVSSADFLGKVKAIERGTQHVSVGPLTGLQSALGRLLCCSDLAHRAALRWHAHRQARIGRKPVAASTRTSPC